MLGFLGQELKVALFAALLRQDLDYLEQCYSVSTLPS